MSISLVILDRTSPWVLVSKYFRGIRSIFSETSFLKLKDSFWATPETINPWIKENSELAAYRIARSKTISQTAPRSTPAPGIPDTLLTNPSKILVVALPRILGPIMEKTELPAAKSTTIIRENRYGFKYLIIFFNVPLKSLAFSAMPMPPCMGPLPMPALRMGPPPI